MKEYLREAIMESNMAITPTAALPARTNFKVEKNADPLNKDDGEVFHSIVAKLLYVSIWAQTKLQWRESWDSMQTSKANHSF